MAHVKKVHSKAKGGGRIFDIILLALALLLIPAAASWGQTLEALGTYAGPLVVYDHETRQHRLAQVNLQAEQRQAITLGSLPQATPPASPPAVSVAISGQPTFTPSGPGAVRGAERRWKGTSGPFLVLVDSRSDGQVRVTVERSDLADGAGRITYDVTVKLDGATVISRTSVVHDHKVRWTRAFRRPPVRMIPDAERWASLGIVPRYDWSLAGGGNVDPEDADLTLSYGNNLPKFDAPEGSLLNSFQVSALTDQGNASAWQATLQSAEKAGHYATHVRHAATGRPLLIQDAPDHSGLGGGAVKGRDGANLLVPDVAHQRDMAYVAYLLTGDWYFAEEEVFWHSWNTFTQPSGHWRGGQKYGAPAGVLVHPKGNAAGLMNTTQIRSIAWFLRTAAAAAEVYPEDAARIKEQIGNNLEWAGYWFIAPGCDFYHPVGAMHWDNKKIPPGASSDVTDGYAVSNSFYMEIVLQWLVRLGYPAEAWRDHAMKTVVGMTQPGYNRFDIGVHQLAAKAGGQLLPTMGAVWQKSFATRGTTPTTFAEVGGWKKTGESFWHMARAALAAALDAGHPVGSTYSWLDQEMRAYYTDQGTLWWFMPSTGQTPQPPDPCGDGTCGAGETTASCPADCPAPEPDPDPEPDPEPEPEPTPICAEALQAADGSVSLVQPVTECGPAESACPAVNVNTATAEEVSYLPGIGPVFASRIVVGRPYAVPEDLLAVKGIGPATLAGIRAYIIFAGDTTATSEISAEDCN